MKLLRHGPHGHEKPGLLDQSGTIRDLSGHIVNLGPKELSDGALRRLAEIDPNSLPVVAGTTRLGPVLSGVGKFIAIGLNYSDHAAESNMPVPPEPVVFMKATSCLNGPNDPIMLPKDSLKTDWEVELGVVIGRTASYIDQEHALDYVAAYTVVHDVSECEYPARVWRDMG
jgi:2,4-didehydro-3-deoxy-L-rhamnonate hydrolase